MPTAPRLMVAYLNTQQFDVAQQQPGFRPVGMLQGRLNGWLYWTLNPPTLASRLDLKFAIGLRLLGLGKAEGRPQAPRKG